MVDMGARVASGWSACHDAYVKADTFGLFDPLDDGQTSQESRKRSVQSDGIFIPEKKVNATPDRDADQQQGDRHTHKRKCDGCGNRPDLQRTDPCNIGGKCSFWSHPDVNRSKGTSFAQSETGRAYSKLHKYWLVWKYKLQDGRLVENPKP